MPVARSGMATATPSGKFCSPMPSASATAAGRLAASNPAAAAPKATPTASPSGMLCRVMARTSSRERCQWVWMPSASLFGSPGWRWGSSLSASHRKPQPSRKPAVGGSHEGSGPLSERSIAGASSDQ